MKKKLELTDQELNTLLYSLQKQPFELVNELINNIVTQLRSQADAKPEEPVAQAA